MPRLRRPAPDAWEQRNALRRHRNAIRNARPALTLSANAPNPKPQRRRRASGAAALPPMMLARTAASDRGGEKRRSLPARRTRRGGGRSAGRKAFASSQPLGVGVGAAAVPLDELERAVSTMVASVQGSSEAIELLKSQLAEGAEEERLPPLEVRRRAAQQSSRQTAQLQRAYSELLGRTEVLSSELASLRHGRRGEAEVRAEVRDTPSAAHPAELQSIIDSLERGVTESSEQLQTLRGRFDEEIGQAVAIGQAKVADLEHQLEASQAEVRRLARGARGDDEQPDSPRAALLGASEANGGGGQQSQAVPVGVALSEVDAVRASWVQAIRSRDTTATVHLYDAARGRLQGSLSERVASTATPRVGSSNLRKYFKELFTSHDSIQVRGEIAEAAKRGQMHMVADSVATFNAFAEIQYKKDKHTSTVTVQFMWTLSRSATDPAAQLQILTHSAVVTNIRSKRTATRKLHRPISRELPGAEVRGAADTNRTKSGVASSRSREGASRQHKMKQQRRREAAEQRQHPHEKAPLATNSHDRESKQSQHQDKSSQEVRQQHEAAARVQAMQRGKRARQEVRQQHEAAARVQAMQRGKRARQKVRQQHEAAARVQAMQRGNRARKLFKEQHEAAARVQAMQRGKQARQEVRQQHEAAARVQAMQRGKRARQEVRQQHEAAARVQAMQRGKRARQKVRQQHEAAARVQAMQRGNRARKLFKEQRVASDVQHVESVYSDDEFDEDFELSSGSSASVHYPSTFVSSDWQVESSCDDEQSRQAAVRIQSVRRGQRARSELRQQHEAAVRVQAMQRGRRARRGYGQRKAGDSHTKVAEDVPTYSDDEFDEEFEDDSQSLDVDAIWGDTQTAAAAAEGSPASPHLSADGGSVDSLKAFPSIHAIQASPQPDSLGELESIDAELAAIDAAQGKAVVARQSGPPPAKTHRKADSFWSDEDDDDTGLAVEHLGL